MSTCLAEDPLHDKTVWHSEDVDQKSWNSLYTGDVITDEDGVEWIVRQCFCEVVNCSGKALKRLNGKEELDVWDRGRPIA
jgi:hypothetical protein